VVAANLEFVFTNHVARVAAATGREFSLTPETHFGWIEVTVRERRKGGKKFHHRVFKATAEEVSGVILRTLQAAVREGAVQ